METHQTIRSYESTQRSLYTIRSCLIHALNVTWKVHGVRKLGLPMVLPLPLPFLLCFFTKHTRSDRKLGCGNSQVIIRFPGDALLPTVQRPCNGSATEPAAKKCMYRSWFNHSATSKLRNYSGIAVFFGKSLFWACGSCSLNLIRGVDYLDSLDTVGHASVQQPFVRLHGTATCSRRTVLRSVDTPIFIKKANSYIRNFTMRPALRRRLLIFQ